MIKKFHAGLAGKYGINAALLLEYIWREAGENEFHHRHRHEGKTWMRCSGPMFTAAMPYLTTAQVKGAVKKLMKEGVIVKGEFNESRFDRTAWYAFTEYGKKVMEESEREDYD